MGTWDIFKGKDLLSLEDYSAQEINYILKYSGELKEKQKNRLIYKPLEGKTLGMLFQKSSTRTRVSFEVGMYQLGGNALFLSNKDLQLGRGETIADTGRTLSRYLDGIMVRTFNHSEVEELAQAADIPVINGLTDYMHPCQSLADIFTIKEVKGSLSGLKLAYIGDGNNVANSLLIAGAKMGLNVVLACPPGFEPPKEIVEKAKKEVSAGGGIEVINCPETAVRDADVVYTDVWVSMGQEEGKESRMETFKPYQVNSDLMSAASDDAVVMHCLPADRGKEITDEIMDGGRSVIFDQAENRLHVQKAVMVLTMAD